MRYIEISIAEQNLTLYETNMHGGSQIMARYAISSAAAGCGEQTGSLQTPRGRHYIRACIGDGQPIGSVFVGRRPTGEIYSSSLAAKFPQRDWVLTRILWLCGCEPGFNRLGNCDSMRRYIYIHGTPDSEPMGIPRSHGCIRMRNRELIELFDAVGAGTPVTIKES